MSKKYFFLITAPFIFSQAVAQNAGETKTTEKQKKEYTGQELTLKLSSDVSCKFYVDGEYKATVKPGEMVKLNLKKGEYELKAVSTENTEMVYKQYYTVETTGVEKIYQISFAGIPAISPPGKTADTELAAYKTLFDNQKLIVKNDCANDFKIGVLNVTYLTNDNKLKKLELWYDRTVGKGGLLQLDLVEGTQVVWDGSVVSYALGIEYKGSQYIISGIFKNDMKAEDKALHINLDDL